MSFHSMSLFNLTRLAAVALAVTTSALAEMKPRTEKLLWNSVPLSITVPIDSETVLRLPTACEVGVSSGLAGELSVESVNNVVLLTPSAAFSKKRIALRALSGNQVYLIDITATKTATRESFELIDPALAPPVAAATESVADSVPDSAEDAGDVRIALTRFAAREFYAPDRLRGGLSAVRTRVSDLPVELYRGGSVRAIPRAGWAYHQHYVTAVELVNLTPDTRELDPRLLRGSWLTATFQHGVLAPAGAQGATTMVYLVSTAPFEAVL